MMDEDIKQNLIKKNVQEFAVHLYKTAKVVEFLEAKGEVSVANLDTVNKTVRTFADIPSPVDEYLFNIAEVMLTNAVVAFSLKLQEEGFL